MNRKIKYTFLAVVLISILFLSLPIRQSEKVRSYLTDIFYPILKSVQKVTGSVMHLKQWASELSTAAEENIILKREVKKIYQKLIEYKEYEYENKRLKDILQYSNSLKYKSVPAEIIGRDTEKWFKYIIVDKGIKHGVEEGASVVTPYGAVGRVFSCGLYQSKVMLLTDIYSYIGVIVQENRVPGILKGTGTEECKLTFLDKTSDIREGMNVVTSGYSTIFPKGIYVGQIKSNEIISDLYKEAEVELGVDINKIENVLILLNNNIEAQNL